MKNQAAPSAEHTVNLYLAFELSRTKWKLGFSDGRGGRIFRQEAAAGDLTSLRTMIDRAKKRFGVTGEVRSCYEAGREGFWLHRALISMGGINNIVVEPASIEVNRRQRRAKTDRLDLGKLVSQLIRHWRKEEKVWSVVRVPSEEVEQERQLHRSLLVLKEERKQHRTRMQSLLFTQGIDLKVGKSFPAQLERLRRPEDGKSIPEELRGRLEQEYRRLELVEAQIQELERQQRAELKAAAAEDTAKEKMLVLQKLVSIGMNSSWMLMREFFWRTFANRREVGGAIGFTPTPHDSGDSVREQGISGNGNWRVRAMIVELAWCWIRLQPNSKLSRWFEERFAHGGKRMRRIGIVAVARRLVIDLWRYLETGVVPEGAKLKAASA